MKASANDVSDVSASAVALTAEQEAQIEAVRAELENLTTPAVIYEAARIRLPVPPSEADKTQFRNQYGYAIAAVKVMAYIP